MSTTSGRGWSGPPRRARLAALVLLGVLPVVLSGCPRRTARLAMPAGSHVVTLDAPERVRILSMAAGQTFDTTFAAGDHQALLVGRYPRGRHGPRVTIQPTAGAHLLTRADLARGAIVARFVNADSASYRKLGSAGNDIVYWHVDSVATGRWRSLYVSSDPLAATVRDTTLVIHPKENPGVAWAQALARWVWLDDDEGPWVTCTSAGCCTSAKAAARM